MKLTSMRTWAFLAMFCAAVAAFGTNTRAIGAGVLDDPTISCSNGQLYGTLDCWQSGGDPVTCDEIFPDVDTGDAICTDLCSLAGWGGGGLMPQYSCDDGPPLSFQCVCGVPLGG